MHKLNRSEIPTPECLNQYRHGEHNWDNFHSTNKAQVRIALEKMQGRRCAYCECNLDENGQHIEHFRQRDSYPQGTFDWNNLFWSCKRKDSCGSQKDTCGKYNHRDLIKPDIEDPEQFFLFVSDGSIALRSNLTPVQKQRAQETLRIFNLDAQRGPLRRMRQVAAMGYIETAEAIKDLAFNYPPEFWIPVLEEELNLIQTLPFCTAIKHILTPQEEHRL